MRDKEKRDKEIRLALDELADTGAEMKDLIIITSIPDLKPIPDYKLLFASVYGDFEVEYDSTLPPNTLHVMRKEDHEQNQE